MSRARPSGRSPAIACLLALLPVLLASCASPEFRERERVGSWMATLSRFHDAPTVEAAVACLSDDFRLFFATTETDPLPRAAVTEMLRWDIALRRAIEATEHRFDDRSIAAKVHEENDLTRLIDFPGWDFSMTWWFDERGKISAQLVRPDPDEPDFRNWLSPAIAWMRQNRPADLEWLYPDGRLNRSAKAARRWVEVLTEWRAATGRSPVPLVPPSEGVSREDGMAG